MNASRGRRLRILSVEDEVLNRALLRAVLERASDRRLRDAELVEATTLAEGRSRAAQSEHDLVLLDRRLPDGDGFDLARELRAMRTAVRPIIVALTADAVPATRTAAVDAGCTAIVVKPYRPSELTAVIGQLLDAHEAGSSTLQ